MPWSTDDILSKMFGTTKIATITFNSNKNCFMVLPNAWAQEFRRKEVSTFELQWGDSGKGYLSWSGDIGRTSLGASNSNVSIQINGLLGNKLGLRHEQEVLMKPVTSVWSCYKLTVEPASVDDWEILELNSSYVETHLLDQVRVVWMGQILPVWIDKMCIFIKIASTEPDAPCVRLEQNTEMIITPKNRLSQSMPSTPSRHDIHPGHGILSTKARSDSGSGSSSSELSTNSSVSGYISDFDSMSSLSSGFEQHVWSHDASHLSKPAGRDPNLPSMPWEVDPVDIEGAIPWSYKIWRKLVSLVSTEADADRVRQDCANEEDARRKMASEFWKDVRIVARVQPMFNHRRSLKNSRRNLGEVMSAASEVSEDHKKEPPSPDRSHRKTTNRFTRQMSLTSHVVKRREPFVATSADNQNLPSGQVDSLSHLMQPTTVYLSSVGDSEFLWQYAANLEDGSTPPSEYVTFLATMTKQPSPKERNQELKQKLLQQSKKEQIKATQMSANNPSTNVNSQSDPQVNAAVSEDKQDRKLSCVVRIIVHCHELKSHCKTESVNPYTSTVFQDRPTQWYVQIPDVLRRQMGLELSAAVQLKPVVKPPSPINSMVLAPLCDLKDNMDEVMILRAFSQWLTCVSCMISPIPIVQSGNLLSFPITPDFTGEFLLSVNNDGKDSSQDSYYLLHPFVTRKADTSLAPKAKLDAKDDGIAKQLPARSVQDLDVSVKGFRLSELGPMQGVGTEALEHVTATLTSRPLGRQLCASVPGQCHGGVLVCGGRGCGKSSVARAVCQEASEWPLLAFVKVVECRALKGKGVDTIRKIWEEAFDEAAWRQPSVILFDDLDHVTAAPLGPEQEMGPEATYNSSLAQVLKDLVMNEISEGSRIALIATSSSKKSIHPSLLSSRGLHLFQTCLEINPLSKTDRASLLSSIIHSKVEIDLQTLTLIDTKHLSGRMDGYVAADLVTVTERAVHAGSSRQISQGHRISVHDSNHPSSEILLCQEDFELALHCYSPAALRDVPLHSAGELGWEDVGGLRGVKQDLIETLELPAKYPELFASCPLRLRSGLLLYGPPGTGKTLLGGVVAKECGLNFISIKGPELLSKYIGASEQSVRDLFTRAMSAKPCILFFDEFDSLAPRRGHDSTGVTDRVVNQLLTQLDGVEGLEGVYVIGATSRPDLIDPALLRPGRLDKCLFCPIPTQEERVEVLQALARKMTLRSDVDLAAIAKKLDHFTGADLKALLYNAQLEAIHSTLMQSDPRDSNLGLPLGDSLHNCSMEADEWKLTFLETFSESDHGQYLDEASNMNQRLASLSEAERALAASMKLTGDLEIDDDDEEEDDGGMRKGEREGRRNELRLDLPDGLTSSDMNGNMSGSMSKTLLNQLMREESMEHDETPSPPEDSAFDRTMTEVGAGGSQPPDTPICAPTLQRVVYMPSLRDGVVDPSPETRDIIANEVDVIVENYSRKLDGENVGGSSDNTVMENVSVIKVSQNHLLRAAQSMKPSVSASERQKYRQIYESFVRSRGGDFPQAQSKEVSQKVTLA